MKINATTCEYWLESQINMTRIKDNQCLEHFKFATISFQSELIEVVMKVTKVRYELNYELTQKQLTNLKKFQIKSSGYCLNINNVDLELMNKLNMKITEIMKNQKSKSKPTENRLIEEMNKISLSNTQKSVTNQKVISNEEDLFSKIVHKEEFKIKIQLYLENLEKWKLLALNRLLQSKQKYIHNYYVLDLHKSLWENLNSNEQYKIEIKNIFNNQYSKIKLNDERVGLVRFLKITNQKFQIDNKLLNNFRSILQLNLTYITIYESEKLKINNLKFLTLKNCNILSLGWFQDLKNLFLQQIKLENINFGNNSIVEPNKCQINSLKVFLIDTNIKHNILCHLFNYSQIRHLQMKNNNGDYSYNFRQMKNLETLYFEADQFKVHVENIKKIYLVSNKYDCKSQIYGKCQNLELVAQSKNIILEQIHINNPIIKEQILCKNQTEQDQINDKSLFDRLKIPQMLSKLKIKDIQNTKENVIQKPKYSNPIEFNWYQ